MAAEPVRDVQPPTGPTGLSARSWWNTLKRTVKEFQEDNLTDWAAALTYYAVLSLFPALIALISIVGLVADPIKTTQALTDIVTQLSPGSRAGETFAGPIKDLTDNRGAAGVLLIVGLATALWTASGYIGALMRASNTMYEVEEGRSFWKLRPLQIAVTLGMVLLLALVAVALVVSGPVAEAVGAAIGLESTAVTIWAIAKWPLMLLVVLTMFSLLYYASPNVKIPGYRWITPGSALAIVLWIVASLLFSIYVVQFPNDKTYGALGGAISFLVWLWITNIAVLLGAELNAELERSREIEAGIPGAERELQLEPRDPPDPPEEPQPQGA